MTDTDTRPLTRAEFRKAWEAFRDKAKAEREFQNTQQGPWSTAVFLAAAQLEGICEQTLAALAADEPQACAPASSAPDATWTLTRGDDELRLDTTGLPGGQCVLRVHSALSRSLLALLGDAQQVTLEIRRKP